MIQELVSILDLSALTSNYFGSAILRRKSESTMRCAERKCKVESTTIVFCRRYYSLLLRYVYHSVLSGGREGFQWIMIYFLKTGGVSSVPIQIDGGTSRVSINFSKVVSLFPHVKLDVK